MKRTPLVKGVRRKPLVNCSAFSLAGPCRASVPSGQRRKVRRQCWRMERTIDFVME